MSEWKPDLYLRFEKERTQPSIDLIARIDFEDPKKILDIGCGPGNSTMVLKNKWQNADVTGLDNSKTMIEAAGEKYKDINWINIDASENLSHLGSFDIVFSNAAIQWIPNHHLLLPKLFHMLNPNGVLAVQVPYIQEMPVYIELEKLAKSKKWQSSFKDIGNKHSNYPPSYYYEILSQISSGIDLWLIQYYHMMNCHDDIISWYKGTGLRPYLDCLQLEELEGEFMKDFKEVLVEAYPKESDNRILFPFTRVFFTAQR